MEIAKVCHKYLQNLNKLSAVRGIEAKSRNVLSYT
jgi:hypothetical protein